MDDIETADLFTEVCRSLDKWLQSGDARFPTTK
jgi:hypothetical protein